MKHLIIFLTISALPSFRLLASDSPNPTYTQEHSLTLFFDNNFQEAITRLSGFNRPLYLAYITAQQKGLVCEPSFGYDRQVRDGRYHLYKPANAHVIVVSSWPLFTQDDLDFALKPTESGNQIAHQGPVVGQEKLAILSRLAGGHFDRQKLKNEMLTIYQITHKDRLSLHATISIERQHEEECFTITEHN